MQPSPPGAGPSSAGERAWRASRRGTAGTSPSRPGGSRRGAPNRTQPPPLQSRACRKEGRFRCVHEHCREPHGGESCEREGGRLKVQRRGPAGRCGMGPAKSGIFMHQPCRPLCCWLVLAVPAADAADDQLTCGAARPFGAWRSQACPSLPDRPCCKQEGGTVAEAGKGHTQPCEFQADTNRRWQCGMRPAKHPAFMPRECLTGTQSC